jgi:hypothetical protein
MEQAVNLIGFRGKTMWDWLRLLIVPAVILGATGALIYFAKRRENKRADVLLEAKRERADARIDAALDATRGRAGRIAAT